MSPVFEETTDGRVKVNLILKLSTHGPCFRLLNGSNRCSGYLRGLKHVFRAIGEEIVGAMHFDGICGIFEKF